MAGDVSSAYQRIAMAIEFDGRDFHGWQMQENACSVQAALQQSLAGIEGREVQVVAAGRTDAGVHAEALLVHADVAAARWNRSHRAYLHGCNSRLPESVRVVGVRAVDADFHARFDCRGRSYIYRIWNRNTASALAQWRHWWMPRAIDVSAMQAAASHLIGCHDFSAIRAAGCQAGSAVRTIRQLDVKSCGCSVEIHVSADAFLYHMVRNLVGNLVDVGIGKKAPEAMAALLASRDRAQGGATAPAHGLYFVDADYDGFSARELIGCY